MVVAALIVLYFFIDPAQSPFAPKCLFHEITGYDCPGCGSQRALHALLHGKFSRAWSFNPFIFIIIPVAVALGLIEAGRARFPRIYKKVYRPSTFILIIILIIGWTILRNIVGL